jgi:membrane protease YdiL (CAAX protease family)
MVPRRVRLPSAPSRRETRSPLGIYVSALWGIWHYPVIPGHQIQTLLPTFATVIPFHILIGVPLSLFWRRSGNLFVPASVHCLIDAVRNGLVGPPV